MTQAAKINTQVVKINVVAALKDTEYEEVSSKLAEEFEKVGIITKEQVHNAPLKLKITHGVDVYKVMDFITAYVDPVTKKRTKGVTK